MAYQTIRELMARVRSLHGRLRESVHDARRRADDERTALLLDFIDQHEAAIERAVETVERRGGRAVLDTWLQFEQDAALERAMELREPDAAAPSESIVTHLLETENALIRLYQLLQGSSGSPTVQSFFAGLLEMEDSAVRRSARARLEAVDL